MLPRVFDRVAERLFCPLGASGEAVGSILAVHYEPTLAALRQPLRDRTVVCSSSSLHGRAGGARRGWRAGVVWRSSGKRRRRRWSQRRLVARDACIVVAELGREVDEHRVGAGNRASWAMKIRGRGGVKPDRFALHVHTPDTREPQYHVKTRAPPTISLCHCPQNTTAGRVWLYTLLYGNSLYRLYATAIHPSRLVPARPSRYTAYTAYTAIHAIHAIQHYTASLSCSRALEAVRALQAQRSLAGGFAQRSSTMSSTGHSIRPLSWTRA